MAAHVSRETSTILTNRRHCPAVQTKQDPQYTLSRFSLLRSPTSRPHTILLFIPGNQEGTASTCCPTPAHVSRLLPHSRLQDTTVTRLPFTASGSHVPHPQSHRILQIPSQNSPLYPYPSLSQVCISSPHPFQARWPSHATHGIPPLASPRMTPSYLSASQLWSQRFTAYTLVTS